MIPPFLAKIFSGGAGNIIESIGKVADTFITTKSEKNAFNAEVQKEINRHIEAIELQAHTSVESYLKDVQDARDLQKVALGQSDLFSKRFIYYFAAGITLLTMAYDFLFFFVHFPPENKDLLVTTAGVLNTSCLVMVISFFFGSSKSSEDKQKQIMRMIDNPK